MAAICRHAAAKSVFPLGRDRPDVNLPPDHRPPGKPKRPVPGRRGPEVQATGGPTRYPDRPFQRRTFVARPDARIRGETHTSRPAVCSHCLKPGLDIFAGGWRSTRQGFHRSAELLREPRLKNGPTRARFRKAAIVSRAKLAIREDPPGLQPGSGTGLRAGSYPVGLQEHLKRLQPGWFQDFKALTK